MSAKRCEDVIQDIGLGETDGTGKKVTRDSTNGAYGLLTADEPSDFLDSVIRAAGKVNTAAQNLYMYDCSEHLVEWIYKVCPSLKTAGKYIDNAVKKANSLTTGIKIGDFIQGGGFTKEFCNIVTSVFGTVNAWLEIIVKAAFALFDKIDAARDRMQRALKSITDAVLECILDVYDMIEKYVGGLLSVAVNWNWEAFENLLITCPCVCRFISYVTSCDEDEDGNNISDQPDKVVRCIREKFWYLDGHNLAISLSELMDTYIKQYLVLLFDAIKLAIDSIFILFITPFRTLIKSYADILRKKLDVTYIIKSLRTSHLDCLLVYTKDVELGETIYRMSVLDMMSSMKMWVNCLEYLCPALSERIKNKVKKYNEDFRLNGEFWNRAFESDIYLCCMRADQASEGFSLDELGSMWHDLLDRLRAINDRAKNKIESLKVTYGLDLSSTGGIQHYTDEMRGSGEYAGIDGKGQDTSVADAVRFIVSPDLGDYLFPGNIPLSDQEDKILMKIGLSLAAGTAEDTYFDEKYAQFIRFISMYAFSGNTLRELSDSMERGAHVDSPSRSGSGNQFPGTTIRPPVDDEQEYDGVNYWVDSDYDSERVDTILSSKWPVQLPGESLSTYYARMYSMVV